jgi:hypothetical protein
MPLDGTIHSYLLVVLAFLTRSSALTVAALLYVQFARAKGPFAPYFKHAFGALTFLLLWVWVASISELVGYIKGASAAVELGANYIFVPNLVITLWLGRLLLKFRDNRREREEEGSARGDS